MTYNPYAKAIDALEKEKKRVKGEVTRRERVERESLNYVEFIAPLVSEIGRAEASVTIARLANDRNGLGEAKKKLRSLKARYNKYERARKPEWFEGTVTLMQAVSRLEEAIRNVKDLSRRFELRFMMESGE